MVWILGGLASCGEAPASAAVPERTEEDRLAIDPRVGPTSHLSEQERRAFAFAEDFVPLPDPEPGHWRFEHPEPAEDFLQFRAGEPHVVVAPRRVVYVVPIGDVAGEGGPPIDRLREHAEVFFGLEVMVLEPVSVDAVGAKTRDNGGVRQLLAPDVLDYLRGRIPWDAYCVLGLTMEDLYPAEDWNYVFGLASTHDRVGVFSFRRYDPRFYDEGAQRDVAVVLERGLKVMTHELGHMFGMAHCDHYRCIMNGSNHVGELDGAPLHLCPVCLRKLHYVTGFGLAQRYEALQATYEKLGMQLAGAFVTRRRSRMGPEP